MDMLGRPLARLSREDVLEWVQTGPPENETLELKGALPAKGGQSDPWIVDQSSIGEKARNQLAEELIAFANAHGGALVLGVTETPDKPPRASAIAPVPACVELADRLRLSFRDVIEPQIPGVEVVGIPTEEDGSGIVVARCQQSRMAPHRLTQTLHCYTRRADRTEKMTMREIQDLTLQVERGHSALAASLDQRRNAFRDFWNERLKQAETGLALRFTAVPTGKVFLGPPIRNEDARPYQSSFMATFQDGATLELPMPFRVFDWRPVLRGVTAYGDRGSATSCWTLFADGLIEFTLAIDTGPQRDHTLAPAWFVSGLCNVLCTIERIRRISGAAGTEYGLEPEIAVRGAPLPVCDYAGKGMRDMGVFAEGDHKFPVYGVYEADAFNEIAANIEQDFWNAAGADWPRDMSIDFARVLKDGEPTALPK